MKVRDTDREIAFNVLMAVETGGAYSNLALNSALSKAEVRSPGFIREMVYGVLRNRILLDYNIDAMLKAPSRRLETAVRMLLRLGFYQLLFMDSVTDYAAVDQTVELLSPQEKGKRGFINGVLRSFVRGGKGIKLPSEADTVLRLSVEHSYAPWIVEMWISDYGREGAEELLAAGNRIPPLTLRTNTNKIETEKLKSMLGAEGFPLLGSGNEREPLAKTCIEVKGGDIISHSFYREGLCSVQDASSQFAVEMLAPSKGERIIDICASPGGKSCAAAELMKNEGEVISFDLTRKKTLLVDREARRLGLSIVKSAARDSSVADPSLAASADAVIADVPCTGLGVVRRKPEIKLGSKEDISGLLNMQAKLLIAGASYVRPGGRLMYTTCTINSAENEERIDDFLSSGGGGFQREFQRQLLPSTDGTDGFFICILRRKA